MGKYRPTNIVESLLTYLGIGRLGQNTLLSTVGLGTRAVIQAGYLILLAHWMGAEGYGLFAGSVAAAVLISPLAGWGVSYVLSRRVSRDRSKSRALWATGLWQIALTGALLVALLMLASGFLLHARVSVIAMLLLGLAELIALPAAQLATSACLALDRGGSAAVSMCLVPAGRLVAVGLAALLGIAGSPDHVAVLHFTGSILGLIATLFLIAKIDGWPAWRAKLSLRETTREGTRYAAGALVGTSYQEVDKVLMLQLLGAAIVGPYTAAFRVISVFALPIAALMGAALPRLFAARDIAVSQRTRRALTLAATSYAIVAVVIAILISPLMPTIFGASFSEATHYLLLLAPWPILYALHQSAATTLTGCDRQGARVAVEGLGLVIIITLNLLLLRSMGAAASVLALLVTEAFMAAGCWLLLRRA